MIVNKPLPQMDTDEIGQVYADAITYNRIVSVQIEQKDCNENYIDNIIGIITKSDELGFWVNDTKIDFDEIRNIELIEHEKCFDIDV